MNEVVDRGGWLLVVYHYDYYCNTAGPQGKAAGKEKVSNASKNEMQ